MPRICLDPGHGGVDPGASGNGLKESDLTLSIALQLKPLLIANGFDVILTREGDISCELSSRVTVSDDFKADLFVSIHVNAGGGTGQEVLITGTGGKAEIAANKLLYYLLQVGGWRNRGVKIRNVYVLRNTIAPAILTENGFIDSVEDSAKLKDPAFIHSLAIAHCKGVCDYFGISYKESISNVSTPPSVPSAVDKTTQAIELLNQAILLLKG